MKKLQSPNGISGLEVRRWCPGCRESKLVGSFFFNKKTGKPSKFCRACWVLKKEAVRLEQD